MTLTARQPPHRWPHLRSIFRMINDNADSVCGGALFGDVETRSDALSSTTEAIVRRNQLSPPLSIHATKLAFNGAPYHSPLVHDRELRHSPLPQYCPIAHITYPPCRPTHSSFSRRNDAVAASYRQTLSWLSRGLHLNNMPYQVCGQLLLSKVL